MNTIRRLLRLAWASALVVALGACEGTDCEQNPMGPNCPRPPTPTPTPTLPELWDSGSGKLPSLVALLRPLTTTTRTGSFDATVDWTFTENDVDVFLMRGTCTFAQLVTDQCVVVASATNVGTKQERIRAANQPAGAYTFVVVNFGPGDESIAYQVLFTAGSSASSTTRASQAGGPGKEVHLLRGSTTLE